MSKKILHLGAAVAVVMAVSFLFWGEVRAGTMSEIEEPNITVTSPNGGEEWEIGQEQIIKWNYSEGLNNEGTIFLVNDALFSNPVRILSVTLSSVGGYGTYNWIIPDVLLIDVAGDGNKVEAIIESNGQYKIMFQSGDIWDQSDDYFSIVDSATTCTDSDGGKNYYVKGTVEHYRGILSDYCIDSNTLLEGYCLATADSQGNVFSSVNYTCPNGCNDGACISATTNSAPEIGTYSIPTQILTGQRYSFEWNATDKDNDDLVWSVNWGDGGGVSGTCQFPSSQQGQGWTFGTDHIWQKAGTYTVKITVSDCNGGTDAQSFSVKAEDTGTICTDSDGGKNYYVKGTVEHYRGILNDYCIDSDTLLEGYCLVAADSQGNVFSSVNYTCPNGCNDGACVVGTENLPPVITSLGGPTDISVNQAGTWTIQAYDPDGDYLTYSVDWGDVIYPHVATVDEKSETTSQSATFSHSYLNSGNYTITLKVTDDQGLSAKSTITVQVGESVEECTDSDGGKNYYVKGKVCRGNCWNDSCSNNGYICFSNPNDPNCITNGKWNGNHSKFVDEHYCENNYSKTVSYECPNGCVDGACVEDTCSPEKSKRCSPVYNAYDWCVDVDGDGSNEWALKEYCSENEICKNGACVLKDKEDKPIIPPAGFEDEVITNFVNYRNPFSDTVIDSLEGKAAAELYRRGVIGGFSDGEFKGSQLVNRAEATKFLLLARGIETGNLKNNGKFHDVKSGEWYEKFVMEAAERGILNGHPDGTFRPADAVNTVEFLKMLTKTFNLSNLKHPYLDVPDSAWYAPFVGIAAPKDWSEYKNGYDLFPNTRSPNRLQPAQNLTRNEVAVAIYQFLKNQ